MPQHKSIWPQQKSGFTLIEILIALFIFVILAMIIAAGLSTIMQTQERIRQRTEQFGQLQMALTLLQRDIEQAINRPIIDATGQTKPAFELNTNSLEFTHTGYLNPAAVQKRSTLQRVAYEVNGRQLLRKTWQALDRVALSTADQRAILDNISDWQVRVLSKELSYATLWPSASQSVNVMPVAVEIHFKWQNNLEVLRLIKVPG